MNICLRRVKQYPLLYHWLNQLFSNTSNLSANVWCSADNCFLFLILYLFNCFFAFWWKSHLQEKPLKCCIGECKEKEEKKRKRNHWKRNFNQTFIIKSTVFTYYNADRRIYLIHEVYIHTFRLSVNPTDSISIPFLHHWVWHSYKIC